MELERYRHLANFSKLPPRFFLLLLSPARAGLPEEHLPASFGSRFVFSRSPSLVLARLPEEHLPAWVGGLLSPCFSRLHTSRCV